jgi:hypothetical protein
MLAEGARFELAVHEVDAGFQDRWFQPLTHPSEAKYFDRIVGTKLRRAGNNRMFRITSQRDGYK